MKLTTKKLSVAVLATLLAALAVLVTGCVSGGTTTPPTSSPPPAKTGTPAKLAFITQPGGAMAGSALSTQPAVTIQDSSGNTVTSSIAPVRLVITPATGTSGAVLFGPSTINAVNGVARFDALSIDKAAAGYTITATSGTMTPATSTPFTISPGAPAKLVFTVQPVGGAAGSPLPTQPEVTIQDNAGNTVTGYEGPVTVALTYSTGPTAAVLSGTTSVRAVNSVARFTDLSINRSNPEYTLTAMSDSLASVNSLRFAIVHAAPVKLEFTVQPAGAKAGSPFETPPKVVVEDTYGNVVTTSRASLTVSITPGTGTAGAILSGTKTRVAEDAMGGLAEFTDISIDRAGAGYTLTATSSGPTPATSQAFDVAP